MVVMTDYTRLEGKRAHLSNLINSLSPVARNSILKTVEYVTNDQRDEYATQFTRGLFHGLISGDEYTWLMGLALSEYIPELDRVFLARLSFELQGLTALKFEETETASQLKH